MLKVPFLLPLLLHLSRSIEEIWSLEEDFPEWKDRVCQEDKIPILGLFPTRTRSRPEYKLFREFIKELEKSSEDLFEFAWTSDDVQYEWYRNKDPTFVIYVDYDMNDGSHIGCKKSRSHYVYRHDKNPVLMAGWVKLYAFPFIIEMQSYEKYTQMLIHVKVPKLWIYRREGFDYPDYFLEMAKIHRGNILMITAKVRPAREGEKDPIEWQPGGWALEFDMIAARFRYGGDIDDKLKVAQWIDDSLEGVADVMNHGRALGIEGTSRWEEFLSVEMHKLSLEVNSKYRLAKEDVAKEDVAQEESEDGEIQDLKDDLLDPEVPHSVNVRDHDEL